MTRTRTPPPRPPAVAPARPIWLLGPGAKIVRLERSKAAAAQAEGATRWCYEGDKVWRSIDTLFAREGK
jgi:hypothetical protein